MKPLQYHLFLLFFFAASLGFAKSPVNKSFFGGVAIKGYDPVAYFTEKKPVKGVKAHSHKWNGATWRFASEANRKTFAAAPEKYAPQFGGYCAWAVSQGDAADIAPEQWTVHEGKLYLNYNKEINQRWLEKKDAFIKSAERHWPSIVD